MNYYPMKKIKTITKITKSFYKDWDDAAYRKYMQLFKLEENKTPSQLSEGMKVKFALALALSHNAKLLLLEEPTSGLDPVSRDELLDVFMDLSEQGITILFSTHITSDLDKCADNIVYMKEGAIVAEDELHHFVDSYKVVELSKEELTKEVESKLIGYKRSKQGYSAIVKSEYAAECPGIVTNADLDSIMVHIEKEEVNE